MIVFVIVRTRPLRLLIPVTAALIAFFAATFSIAGSRPSLAPSTTQAALPATTSATKTVKPAATTTTATVTTATVTTTTATTATAPSAKGGGGRFTAELAPTISETKVSETKVSETKVSATNAPIPFVPERDEIGFPGIYQYKPIFALGSGRVYAWLSALRQGLERPLLGYGFGTEQYVFVDRFYIFDGGYTENSFVGIFLQLGVFGVALLLAPFVLVAVLAVRASRARLADDRTLIAVGAGTVAGGFLVAFFQSYLYSVGNVATLTFWIVVFLAVTAVSPPVGRRAVAE